MKKYYCILVWLPTITEQIILQGYGLKEVAKGYQVIFEDETERDKHLSKLKKLITVKTLVIDEKQANKSIYNIALINK